jgi:hypothetical protein
VDNKRNEMNAKKLYIWRLARFLHGEGMTMSGGELASHLNRNSVLTSYGEEYKGKRGTYKLVKETWKWVHHDLGLPEEAECIAKAFVDALGNFAYEI